LDQQRTKPLSSVYARVLWRAVETVGGVERLARELGVPRPALDLWLEGKNAPPHEVFTQALSIDALGPFYQPKT
jgi:hypothetical protein